MVHYMWDNLSLNYAWYTTVDMCECSYPSYLFRRLSHIDLLVVGLCWPISGSLRVHDRLGLITAIYSKFQNSLKMRVCKDSGVAALFLKRSFQKLCLKVKYFESSTTRPERKRKMGDLEKFAKTKQKRKNNSRSVIFYLHLGYLLSPYVATKLDQSIKTSTR